MNCFRPEKVHSSEGGRWKEWHVDCLLSSSPGLSNITKHSISYLSAGLDSLLAIYLKKNPLVVEQNMCSTWRSACKILELSPISRHQLIYLDPGTSLVRLHFSVETIFKKFSNTRKELEKSFFIVFFKILKATIPKRRL